MDKEDAITLLRSLLISSKNSYSVSELLRDFRKETGQKLPLFGYKTEVDFFESIPHVLQLKRTPKEVYVSHLENEKTAHISSLVKRQNESHSPRHPVPLPVVKKKIRRKKRRSDDLSSEFGVQSTSRDDSSYNENKTKFSDGNDKQSQSDISSCESTSPSPKISDTSLKYSSNQDCDLTCSSNIKMCGTKSSGDSSASKPVSPNQDKYFTEEVLFQLNDLPSLELELYARNGEYVEVCVTEVSHPHKFFLQLRRFKLKLSALMNELQLFYSESKDLLIEKPTSSLLCAALYKTNSECSEWHRAMILKVVNRLIVIVFLIDYGTIVKVQANKIRHLHKKFGNLAPQAFQGHLANIVPTDKEWSRKSIERFYNMVFDRDLIAGVVDVNYKEKWLSVALSYTDEVDIHISDTLVDEELAVLNCNDSTVIPIDIPSLYLDIKNWLLPSDIRRSRKSRAKVDNEVDYITDEIKNKLKSFSIDEKVDFSCYTTKNTYLLEMFNKKKS